MYTTQKTSTAILLALSLAQPMPALAQDQQIPEGAVCADGANPPCAEGVELVLPNGTRILPDGTRIEGQGEKPGADARQGNGAMPSLKLPGQQAPAGQGNAAQGNGAEKRLPSLPGAGGTQESQQQPSQPETAEEVKSAPAEAGTAETPPDAKPAADASTESAPKPAEDTAPDRAEAPPARPADTGAAETETKPAEILRPLPGGKPADGAVTTAETPAAPVVKPGAEGFAEEARKVLNLLGGAPDAESGAGETAAAAASESAAETTTETEVTEADTRQSSEDFQTTASGEARVQTGAAAQAGKDDGLSNFEKAALVGLGILAVGAILNNGDEVVANTGDRVVVRRGENDYYVLKDDDALLRQPGSNLRTESFSDGSTRTTVTRDDGSRIVTIRDAAGRVLRRTRIDADGRETLLIDDTEGYDAVQVSTLPPAATNEVTLDQTDPAALRRALEAASRDPGRRFSLRQIRDIGPVRKLVPEIVFDPVTFRTGSAAIDPSEAEELARLGDLMVTLINDNPGEVFLIEGHTDAVGAASFNLALSDRRAESVALALTEYFDVPPENMVVQGYGESDLKVDTQGDERLNRRVSVRRITPLLDQRMARN